MNKQFFITGTDTGVGKTVLAAVLCAGLDAWYWKPVQTGTAEGTDRATVMRLAGIGAERTLEETYSFVPPVSPHLAAHWAGVRIELERFRVPAEAGGQRLIVEGAGGVLVPLNEQQFMLDLIKRLHMPVILAARSGLGTINHTLLSLAALHSAEVPVHGVVLIGEPNKDNRASIERYGHTRVLGEIPMLAQLQRSALLQVFLNHFERDAFPR